MLNKIELDPRINKKEDIVEKPIVIRVNKFTEEDASDFQEEIDKAHSTGQNIIPIVVDSYGGSVYTLLNYIHIIQNSELPVATVCESKCMSAGSVLMSFGKEGYRFMAPYATMMIHEVSSWAAGKVSELKEDTKEADRLNTLIFELMAKNVGKAEDYFLKMIHEKNHADWYLTSEEVKSHGLIDHIRVPHFKTTVKVETHLI